MKHFFSQYFRRAVPLGLLALMTAGTSLAVPTLTLTASGGGTAKIEDNCIVLGPNCTAFDLDSTVGSVLFAGTVGVFNVNITSGITKPELGSALIPQLSFSSQNKSTVANPAAVNTLTIEFTEDQFTANPFQAVFEADPTNLLGGTATFEALLNGSTYASLPTTGGLVTGPALTPAGPYSLTLKTVLTHTGTQTTNTGLQLSAVPEPGSYGILALSLSGLGMVVARRRAKVSSSSDVTA